MLYRIGDVLLAITLFVNAAAVLNFQARPGTEETTKGRFFECIQAVRGLRFLVCLWNVIMLVAIVL